LLRGWEGDLQDAILVPGFDLTGVYPFREGHCAGELAVSDFPVEVVLLFFLLFLLAFPFDG
jgi:hypothetical protein